MDFLEIKDAIYLALFGMALWRFSASQRKQAAEVAAWRATKDAEIARLDEKLAAHKDAHDGEAAKQEAFRKDAYQFFGQVRDRLTRLEARANGG